jgi:hypothetical protein
MKIFLLILITLYSSMLVSGKDTFDERLKNLVLRAKVLETKIDRTDAIYPSCQLKIQVTFTNEGNVPIIILQKTEEDDGFSNLIFSSGVSVYGNWQYGNYIIQNFHALPSICTGCNEGIGKILEQKTPPDKYTKILKPKESLTFIEESGFGLTLKTKSGWYGWDEVEKNNWKVVGSITYSMFPINLGKYGENFGHKLQKRWKKFGILYVGDTHSLISSERFEIDLTGVKF